MDYNNNGYASSAPMPPFPLNFDFMPSSNTNNNTNNTNTEINPFAIQPSQPNSKGWTHQYVYPTSSQPEQKKITEDMDIDLCVPCGGCGSKTYQWSARKELPDPVTKEKVVYCSIGCILRLKKVYNGYPL